MKNILLYLSQISKIFWMVFGVSLIALIITIILSAKHHTNPEITTLVIFVFFANNSLAIVFYQKDKIIPLILATASILVSIFSILIIIR